jgi:(p)ppGpp synthase/HD superfamily hydrolase
MANPDFEVQSLRFDLALLIAKQAHHGQLDLAGQPYLWHLLRVGVSLLPDMDAAIAGLLHDVLEDDPVSGNFILCRTFTGPILPAVRTLTRNKPSESYNDYIRRVALDPLAAKVKFADLADNLRPDRLAAVAAAKGQERADELRQRYIAALDYLRGNIFVAEYMARDIFSGS